MTDSELTALAVRAFGDAPKDFAPLTDDGDRYRLARKLGLAVDFGVGIVTKNGVFTARYFTPGNDEQEAMAIVSLAAAIGQAMLTREAGK